MTIQGYVREPGSGDTWATANRSRPKGYRIVVVDEFEREQRAPRWRRLSAPRRCRFMENRKSCGRPSVVEMMRGNFDTRRPWGYCERHLYGRRWENGRLLASILVAEDEQP